MERKNWVTKSESDFRQVIMLVAGWQLGTNRSVLQIPNPVLFSLNIPLKLSLSKFLCFRIKVKKTKLSLHGKIYQS